MKASCRAGALDFGRARYFFFNSIKSSKHINVYARNGNAEITFAICREGRKSERFVDLRGCRTCKSHPRIIVTLKAIMASRFPLNINYAFALRVYLSVRYFPIYRDTEF